MSGKILNQADAVKAISNPLRTRSVLERSPITLRIGRGNVFTRVGVAII